MTRPSRGSIEADESPSFQDPVEDSGSQVLVVQHFSPFIQRFIGGEDHGALAQVPVVNHVEEHVGSVLRIG